MIALQHAQSAGIGYGRMGYAVREELEMRGLCAPATDPSQEGDKVAPVALFINLPVHVAGWWEGQYKVLWTMFETTSLPVTFRENIGDFDMILVPSEHNRDLFSRYHHNVKQVPLGIDPKIWHFVERPAPDPFVFFTSGSSKRKGCDLSVAAFKRVRDIIVARGDQPPRLVMRSTVNVSDPDIAVINHPVSDEEELKLYAQANCYLAPSRGEGWGLMPHQAISQGCPTILTDAHGQREFSDYGIRISADLVDAEYEALFWGDSGKWWEPSLDELAERMLDVHDNYQEALIYAKECHTAAQDLSWRASVDTLIDTLGERVTTPDVAATTWVKPSCSLYRVVTTQALQHDVGGTTYRYKKGEESFVPADVKRILAEAKLLDPSCLVADEPGFSAAEVTRLASQCPTCGQEMKWQT